MIEKIDLLEQDIQDLVEMSNAERCLNCNRFYPVGYICPHCDTDNSSYQ